MTQLPLSFAAAPVFSAGSFFVSGANREAEAWVARWPDWPTHALVITGPAGSGKTHLAHLWAQAAQAAWHEAAALSGDAASPVSARHTAVIENIEHLRSEEALFHLLNAAKEAGGSLLLTSALAPPQWRFALPDLRSRLAALPKAAIARPDDELLAAVLTKHFADRQLAAPKETVTYLAARMERSFAAAAALAERLDALALSEQKPLTVALARRALADAATVA